MGLDLDSIDHDKLSKALGTGDWAIALPLGYPDFVISKAWRAKQRARIAERFVRWVLGGQRIEIVHDSDPSWDHSGKAERIRTDPEQLLMRYEKLGHWMKKEPTGNSEATFESHYGLHWPTYGEELLDDIERALYDLLKETFPILESDMDQMDDIVNEMAWGFSAMADVIKRRVARMSTDEVWIHLEDRTRAKIEIEKRAEQKRAAEYEAMSEQVHAFWQMHFPALMGAHIDKIVYHEHNLETRLPELFADAPPMLLKAFIEVRIPASTSNSVDLSIRQMARDALA